VKPFGEDAGQAPPSPPSPPSLGPLGGYWRIAVIGVLLVPTFALSAVSDVHNLDAIRAAVTLAFMAMGPGMALMGLLRLDDLLLELSLALALSLVLETIVAMAMLLLNRWDPAAGLAVLEVLTVIGVLAQASQVSKLKQRNHYQPAASPPP
jgi:nucleoside recognition membrane protein YjiH